MANVDEALVKAELLALLTGIDDDALSYFTGMVTEVGLDEETLDETLSPFIESYGLAESIEAAGKVCKELCRRLRAKGLKEAPTSASSSGTSELLEKPLVLSEMHKSQINKMDQETIDTLWGFDSIRQKRNDTIETTEAGSARYERKAAKEQKKFLDALESRFEGEEEDACQISNMMLPDLSGTSRELDIHVSNFTITYGGQVLLEGADLRLVRGRRYGLIGRNGVGKTTLLKHMANFDIEGFPRHHRVLHVKQEVKSSAQSVLEVVLDADVERKELLKREAEILALQNADGPSASAAVGDEAAAQRLADELQAVYQRMEAIGCATAEARAASILSGLRFTDAMQHCPTDSLSGGWRMRVALAGALFIEPDLLMLDEPTNHLDLEAVLWLEDYLQTYPHTVLLVSHDRAFLNDVCTDTILFKDQKLTYYRGNYDAFESTRKEMLLVQQRQHEAQMVKINHMQEFVDKFRYNAKRASLVQSRIKAIAREGVVEAVEEDTDGFRFSFIDAGMLGRPVIQIEGVSFGFRKDSTTVLALHEENRVAAAASASAASSGPESLLEETYNVLFSDVHLNIDQESRVALVGPNGAGKTTLLNIIQGKLAPLAGYVHTNPQLRLAVFTQYHLDSFDLQLSPLQNLAKRWPLVPESELRAHLGRYEVTGNDALKPMKFSSGGQKSRVAFAALTFSKPHVVILDEPTNHLDMEAIQALAGALNEFKGGVVVISHDQHFIQQVCREVWVVESRQVAQFKGSFAEYKKASLSKLRPTSRRP